MAGGTDVVAFFSEEDVMSLSGLTKSQLRYWDRTRLYSPKVPRSRSDIPALYDFRDLIALRALARFRSQLMSLQRLRKLADYLKRYSDEPWSKLTFHIDGRELFFEDPATGKLMSTDPRGQSAHDKIVRMKDIADETHQKVLKMRKRGAKAVGKVERYRRVQHNRTVLAGTRVPTSAIWAFKQENYSDRRIQREYPSLSLKDIRAAVEHEQKKSHAA